MHRTQILLPAELERRTEASARRHGISKGEVVRRALAEYLDKRRQPGAGGSGEGRGGGHDEIEALLLDDPFDDPGPDPRLSIDVDHHLYGAARRPAPDLRGKRR